MMICKILVTLWDSVLYFFLKIKTNCVLVVYERIIRKYFNILNTITATVAKYITSIVPKI